MRSLWLWFIGLYVAQILALHLSEAGVVDWHKPFVGVPLVSSLSTAPTFHRLAKSGAATQSVILTATSSNGLAALNPVDGSIVWRHIFEDNEHIIAYKERDDVVAAVSGPGGATLRLLDALTGNLLLERRLHRPEFGRSFEPEALGTAVEFEAGNKSSDVFALSNAYILRRIDGETGEIKWEWTSPDQASLVAYSKVVTSPLATYVIGLAKSFASYTLHITSLSSTTGELIASAHIPSSIHNGLTDFLLLGNTKQPLWNHRVVWLEEGAVKSVALTPELKEKTTAMKGAVFKRIVDVGLRDHGLFVAQKVDNTRHVVRLEENGPKDVWEFSESIPSNHYTDSLYTGGLDKDGWPYVVRVYWSHTFKQASVHVFAPHLADGKGLVTGSTFPFKTNNDGIIKHVAVDVANPEAYQVIARLVVTTSTGAVQLWQQDHLLWSREEALADIKVAEFVELPERQINASRVGEFNETYGERLQRQLSEAQDFPQYVLNFVRRFVTGSYASISSSVAPLANATDILSRDTFGFRKLIVAATPYGKVYGIDSANGEIVWSRVFGLGWAAEVGGQVIPVKLFVTRTVSDGDAPQVVLVTQRKANNGLVDTVLFHIDALTGGDVRGVSATADVLQGFDVIAGPMIEAYLVRSGSTKVVVLLDEFVQVHIYPSTPENVDTFNKLLPAIHIPLRTGPPGHRQLTGHQISPHTEFTGKHVAHSTWSLSLPPSEEFLQVIPRPHDPVASLGKVLGNRTTLYKYLNPNLVAVVTGTSTSSMPRCSIYLIDGAKGTIIYHVVLPTVDASCDVKAVLTENWLVYQYYDSEISGVDQAKSYRIVSVELYEGSGIDDKTKSSDLTSLSNETSAVAVFEQSYILSHGITTLSTTSTAYGITMKDLIVANENHQVRAIPRRFLDPRRPKNKPTNQEMEEWLIQYDPLIPDDPKRVLSHTYDVAGIRRIITSPALLESTSLVFAFGLDLFSTRVAPSNTFDVLSENFNKAQLVFTVAGLALAIVIARPMVQRKRLREKWYD
ncbi:hypothetical protein AcV5_010378 [Taiwanofungus camphoratus]|nr:hypothetical protein AcV5_010378 [Antrodia cinnamomea]